MIAFLNDIAAPVTAVAALGTLGVSIVSLFWIREVKHNTNSIMDARVSEAKEASEAKGLKKGREETR